MPLERPKKPKFVLITNDDSLKLPELLNMKRPREQPKQIKFTMSENQPGLSNETRPRQAAKTKGIAKLSEVIIIQNEEERQMLLKDMQKRVSKHIKNENEEQRQGWLEEQRRCNLQHQQRVVQGQAYT